MSPPPPERPRHRPPRRRLPVRQRPTDHGVAERPGRHRGGQPDNVNAVKHGLYARSLSKKALQALQEARELHPSDLTEEIAALRARLATLKPSDHAAFVAGVGLLARIAYTNYRMNPQATKDLAENMTNLLNSLGDQLLPP